MGTRASWYPQFWYLDFDFTDETKAFREHAIGTALDALKLKSSEYFIMTSPSYQENGSCHVAFRLNYRESPPTFNLGMKFLKETLGNHCEIYPQKERLFRLPLGKDQFLITDDNVVLSNNTWQQSMALLAKLDPLNIPAPSSTRTQARATSLRSARFEYEQPDKYRILLEESEVLWNNGLTAKGTRHLSQWRLLCYLYRKNWFPEDAIKEVKRWIRQKHNGFSVSANQNDWSSIHKEIDRQGESVYGYTKYKPDAIQNIQGSLIAKDLIFAARRFPGDIVNQKRMLKLIAYCRPRRHHEWIFIPSHVWKSIASKKLNVEFIRTLEGMKLIDVDWDYKFVQGNRRNGYCRSFKLLFSLRNGKPIMRDGLNLTEFYGAWGQVCGNKVERIAKHTGVKRNSLYRRIVEAQNSCFIKMTPS